MFSKPFVQTEMMRAAIETVTESTRQCFLQCNMKKVHVMGVGFILGVPKIKVGTVRTL